MPFQAVPLLHSSTIGPGWGQAGVLSSRWSETKCLSGLPVLGRMNHILQVCCEFLGVCLCGISMTRWEWVPAAEASIAAWRRWRPGTNLQSEDVRCRFASAGWLGGHLLHPWVSMSPPIEAVCDPLQVSSMNCSREYLSKHWNSCKARDKESWWLYTELFFDIGGGQWQPGPLLPGQSTEIQASGNEALTLRKLPLPGEDADRELRRSILILWSPSRTSNSPKWSSQWCAQVKRKGAQREMERSQPKLGPMTESNQPNGKVAAFSYWWVNSWRETQGDLGRVCRCKHRFFKRQILKRKI